MDVALSDVLTCPRCGPVHGLVLLPTVVRDGRVDVGVLGCPNCRERYPIQGGVADLRVPGGGVAPTSRAGVGGDPEAEGRAVRLGGLLGLAGATGMVVVAGPASASAGDLGRLVEGLRVVVLAGAGDVGGGAGEPGWATVGAGDAVSVIRVGGVVPLRTGSARGVALTGRWTELVAEGMRLLGPASRLLLEPVDRAVRSLAGSVGGMVVLEEGETLVVARRV